MTGNLPDPVVQKLAALNHYGGAKCRVCPESRLGALYLTSDDRSHFHLRVAAKKIQQGYYQYLALIGWPAGLFCLCANDAIRAHNRRMESAGKSLTQAAVTSRRRRRQYKIRALALCGHGCAVCGCQDYEVLTLHHPDFEGKAHRDEISKGRSSTSFYAAIIRDSTLCKGLQVMCLSCNENASFEEDFGPVDGQANLGCQPGVPT
jgi:hypothetical protein